MKCWVSESSLNCRGRISEWSQVREHILRGGDSLCKGPMVEGSNMLLLNSQEACVVGAQRPRGKAGLTEAGGMAEARPPMGSVVRLLILILGTRTHCGWSDMIRLWFENKKKQLQCTYHVPETFKDLCKYELSIFIASSKVNTVVILILLLRKQRHKEVKQPRVTQPRQGQSLSGLPCSLATLLDRRSAQRLLCGA